MADSSTIARPYAKAVFEHALDAGKLALWSDYLNSLAGIALDPSVMDFIGNPASSNAQQVELLMSVIPDSDGESKQLRNFIATLAEKKRLPVLPDIRRLFEALRSEEEKVLIVEVRSVEKLSAEQEQQLIKTLSRRLERQVTLEISIDRDLLGGAVIKAGDLVIDGSVRGKLNKLSVDLAA